MLCVINELSFDTLQKSSLFTVFYILSIKNTMLRDINSPQMDDINEKGGKEREKKKKKSKKKTLKIILLS